MRQRHRRQRHSSSSSVGEAEGEQRGDVQRVGVRRGESLEETLQHIASEERDVIRFEEESQQRAADARRRQEEEEKAAAAAQRRAEREQQRQQARAQAEATKSVLQAFVPPASASTSTPSPAVGATEAAVAEPRASQSVLPPKHFVPAAQPKGNDVIPQWKKELMARRAARRKSTEQQQQQQQQQQSQQHTTPQGEQNRRPAAPWAESKVLRRLSAQPAEREEKQAQKKEEEKPAQKKEGKPQQDAGDWRDKREEWVPPSLRCESFATR